MLPGAPILVTILFILSQFVLSKPLHFVQSVLKRMGRMIRALAHRVSVVGSSRNAIAVAASAGSLKIV